MSFYSLIHILSLAAATAAWPQNPEGSSKSLPFSPRSLPSVQEVESIGTLHVPSKLPRGHLPVVEEDETEVTLPVGLKRHLPVAQDLPGVLTLPVIHAPKPALVGRSIEVQLENRSDVAYYAQLQIGTPSQSVYAQLDTGSWELWVNPSCASLTSSADKTFCDAVGQYDPDDSSSSEATSESKKLNYGIGSASVDYVVDDIALSDSVKLEAVQFGVASNTRDQFAGVLGIGYGKGVNTKYNNFIDELADQGVTETKAFSVALGSKAEGGGVIVFGGVDTGKFKGSLASLPIISAGSAPDGVARYWVELDSISLTAPSGRNKKWDSTSFPVFLDTGATLTLLPPSVVEAIAADFGSDGQDDAGFYNVDCSLVNEAGTVDFAFDGVTVKVPYKEIIREFGGSNPTCYLGISPSEDYALLGDTFLRSAYVVFDLDSDTVFMAQYENCGSDVSSIESSGDLDGLRGSCGGSNDDNDEEEEEEDNNEEDDQATSSESAAATTSSTEATSSAEATTTEAESALPVVTEVVTTASDSSSSDPSSTISDTSSTVSRPTPTGSSDDGPDSTTGDEDSSEANNGGSQSTNEEDPDNAASERGVHMKTMLGLCAGVVAMLML